MAIPLGQETVLDIEVDVDDGLDLVLSGPHAYLSIKLEPTCVAALIALLKAKLPYVTREAERQRRFDLMNNKATTQAERDILLADEDYIGHSKEGGKRK